MTTTVTITPAGHRVRVTTIDKQVDGETHTREVYEPGADAVTVYVHSARSVMIEEVDAPTP